MKLSTASEIFKNLTAYTNNKSELKVYSNFMGLLSDLSNRNLSKDQYDLIEEKLEELNLEVSPENKKRYYRRKLADFRHFLKDKFSLIPKGYYAGIGIALGVAFGAAFGSLFELGVGVSFGMIIGLAIGAFMDAAAKKENRVFNT